MIGSSNRVVGLVWGCVALCCTAAAAPREFTSWPGNLDPKAVGCLNGDPHGQAPLLWCVNAMLGYDGRSCGPGKGGSALK